MNISSNPTSAPLPKPPKLMTNVPTLEFTPQESQFLYDRQQDGSYQLARLPADYAHLNDHVNAIAKGELEVVPAGSTAASLKEDANHAATMRAAFEAEMSRMDAADKAKQTAKMVAAEAKRRADFEASLAAHKRSYGR